VVDCGNCHAYWLASAARGRIQAPEEELMMQPHVETTDQAALYRERRLILATLVSGAATIGLALIMIGVFPSKADLADGFRTPIIAFEFADSEGDLGFLTGSSEAARANRAAMDEGHRYDMVFPFAYGGLLVLLALRLAREGESRAWFGVGFALATIPADIHENLVLLDITAALERGEPVVNLLTPLYIATWLKWCAIAIAIGVIAAALLRKRSWWTGSVSAAASASIVLTWITGADAVVAETMTIVVFVFYLVFVAEAVVELRRHRAPLSARQ